MLPVINTTATAPALSDQERALVGLINPARAERRLASLQISVALNRAADAQATADAAIEGATSCSAWLSAARAADAGWPSAVTGYNVVSYTQKASEAFASLSDAPGQLFNPQSASIGVAFVGDSLSVILGTACDHPRCELTGDTGDAALAGSPDSGSDTGASTGTAKKSNPKLRIRKVRVKGKGARKTVTVTMSVSRKAQGRFRVTSKGGRPGSKTRSFGSTRTPTATLKLKLRKGTYKINVRFLGKGNWKSVATTRTVRVK